jgi:hypothetical protein
LFLALSVKLIVNLLGLPKKMPGGLDRET